MILDRSKSIDTVISKHNYHEKLVHECSGTAILRIRKKYTGTEGLPVKYGRMNTSIKPYHSNLTKRAGKEYKVHKSIMTKKMGE